LTYEISPAAALGLREFASQAANWPVGKVFFGISPAGRSLETSQALAEHKHVADQVGAIFRQSLGDRFELLDIEPFRADEYFVDSVHLNAMGREHYTRTLADILMPRLP
jgi:hypothetical protein